MKKILVIVESPAKIKTIKKFLSDNYELASSIGHIRDLPQKEFGIDIEGDFEPQYTTLEDKKKVIASLKRAAKECDMVYLSPDPDREGEAIAWHISEILPKGTPYKRVTFNSLTKDAVQKAIAEPREIDFCLVNAQQARRLLDRIVGYKISPILSRRIQKKVAGSLSAGRVQSVALKLVVDREKEIESFLPVEYWNINGIFEKKEDQTTVSCYLHSIDGIKIDKESTPDKKLMRIEDQQSATHLVDLLKTLHYSLTSVIRKEKKRHPVPPFITSTLQQEASRHFGFSASKTMRVAQDLYEGIDMGNEGTEGLITYMRTDSVRISDEALFEVRTFISEKYGDALLPETPRSYSSKKSAQEGHEAIRPTNLEHPPEIVRPFLSPDQFNLYSLVWKRFIASQMESAIYDTLSCDLKDTQEKYLFRISGSQLKFKGFLEVYEEKSDDELAQNDNPNLPPLNEGDVLSLQDLQAEQSFTKPPPRFTEASLVKELEKSGIGRPSTYASIMNKIQSREYTLKERKRLKPTELGRVIAAMLEENFPNIMNISFTAQMEDQLEEVARDELQWKTLIKNFWKDFAPTLEVAEKEARVPTISTDIDCPECKKGKLQKVWSRTQYFYGCSDYPECPFTAPIEEIHFNKEDYAPDFNWDQNCPICHNSMKVKHGRFGAFLGCSNYPECKGIVNIPKQGETLYAKEDLPPCPAIGCEGQILQRKSRFGKFFFSCSTFPDCDVIANSIEELEEKYRNHEKTPYKKKAKKAPAKSAKKVPAKKTATKAKTKTKTKAKRTSPSFSCSELLSSIINTNESTRGDAIKKLWEYIREKNLQDPNDKRVIIPDKMLARLFETEDPVSMFKFSAFVSKHLSKK